MKAKLLLLLLLLPFGMLAQQYGNEWIDYSQKYYSFKIWQDGIYRLDSVTIANASIPLGAINTNQFQIFAKQQEIPIYVSDGGDGVLNGGDYIEFYGQKNDGWLDSSLYLDPTKIGNPAYSLYNDTLRYYFTWKNSGVGKRFVEETDISYTSYVPRNFVLSTSFLSYKNTYYQGYIEAGSSSSFFKDGEGWGDTPVNGVPGGASKMYNFATPNYYVGGDAPNLSLSVNVSSSASADNVNPNHHLVLNFVGAPVLNQTYYGYQLIQFNQTYPNSTLTAPITPLAVNIIDDLGALTDYQGLTYASLAYPQVPTFPSSNFLTCGLQNDLSQSKIRIDFNGLLGSSHSAYVFGDVPRKIPLVESGTDYALIPNSGNGLNQKMVVANTATITYISNLKSVTSTGSFTDFSSLNYENSVLMVYTPVFLAASQAYESYRMSPAGGSHNVIFANVDELYDQFGGGIEKHINSIRRFSLYAYNHSTQKPLALFLMGKGSSEPDYRQWDSEFQACYIPSFGFPSSDIAITAKLQGNNLDPLIPTGRVAVISNTQLNDYLNKITQFDAQQDSMSVYDTPSKDWQKHLLHFGGGDDANQQLTFKSYLNQMANVAEHEKFGGYVDSYFKTSSAPFDPVTLETIRTRLQNGVSVMNFFGHATSAGFEINIDDPINWDNVGKYPLVIGNSCYTGDIFHGGSVLSQSEKFVEIPNRGAIGFLSSTSLGFAPYLYYYTNQLYQQFSKISYGQTLGEQIKNTIAVVQGMTANQIMETTCTQMVLNGDPLIRVNPHNHPEIELLESNISFTPTNLDLTTQNITMQIIVNNLGQSITDSVVVNVVRHFPGQATDSIYHQIMPRLDYKDTLYFTMPLQPDVSLGPNIFNVSVDIPSFIKEQYDEINNNQVVKTLMVNIDGILPVLPYDFAVIPTDTISVKASTVNPLASVNTYRFEIDTTDLFNSPFKRYATKTQAGGVKTVRPNEWISSISGMPAPLSFTDSLVCFWRVALDAPTPVWHEQSFQYIPGKEGWGQDHFFQFKKNQFISVNYDRTTRTRKFDPLSARHVFCNVYDRPNWSQTGATNWLIDQNQMEYNLCSYSPSLYVAVIDPATLTPWGTRYYNTTTGTWENPTHNFGNVNDNGGCRPRVENYFIFRQNAAQLAAFENMINAVPDSAYVLIYATPYADYGSWPASTYNLFTSTLFSDSIYPGLSDNAFIFFGKKGTNRLNVEKVAHYNNEFISIDALMPGSIYEGTEISTVIGPSPLWETIYWKQDPSEPTPGDSTMLQISAMDLNHTTQFVIDTTFTRNDSIINLNSIIDATHYPYLQLTAYYEDKTTFTPAQIDRWHVLYGQLPEAALDATAGYYWKNASNDTLLEGASGAFAIDIKNIGKIPMDSLLVNYWIEDENQVRHPIPYPRQDSLRVGQTLRDTITFSTNGLSGLCTFWVEVNPYVYGSNVITDQPEQFHFNNIAQIPLYIKADNENPILDVTFDGVHILNNDIVSPKSEIVISLKDDNPFLLMNQDADTSLFGIYLVDPNNVQKRIPFMNSAGQTVLQWIPATTAYNKFKIIYPGDFPIDGTYTLIVQGTDKSGNLSGDFEYRIAFQVIHESSITYLMNYPNPFSTSTRFVFTLTGEKIPDHMIIQIMSVTGKVVREITESELGTIRIGKNVTEYAWDGKDEFGDLLANGVYLYRVLTDLDNDAIKHRDSGADKYFKKEFGKMYLMR